MPLSLTVNGISQNYVVMLFAAKQQKNVRTAATDADRYTVAPADLGRAL